MPAAPRSKRNDLAPRMLAPGYYSQECNAHKACPESKFYRSGPNDLLYVIT